jgi:hypothetical protein
VEAMTCGTLTIVKGLVFEAAAWFRRGKTWVVATSLAAMLWSGCASDYHSDKTQDLRKYKTVCFAEPGPFDQIYMGEVAKILQRYGLKVSPSKLGPDTLMCVMGEQEDDETFDQIFVISLWADKKRVLFVKARNEDFASHPSRAAANDAMVKEALEKFDKELRKGLKKEEAPAK